MNTRIGAVVVTYHPDAHITECLSALLAQVDHIYVVDNGSDAHSVELLRQYTAQHPDHITLTCNAENRGLAAAQNQGIQQALAAGCEWVLLIDDDSLPQANMVQTMLTSWQQYNDPRIGILAPRLVEQNISMPARYVAPFFGIGFRHHVVQPGEVLHNAALVIASGSLISAEVFHHTGLMQEAFFMDSIDHEFCLRARQEGFTILVVGNAVLQHRQGSKQRIGPVATQNYAPTRRYYIFRHRMWLLHNYGRAFPFLYAYEMLACLWDLARIIFMESDKIAKLRAAWKGFCDGLSTHHQRQPHLSK